MALKENECVCPCCNVLHGLAQSVQYASDLHNLAQHSPETCVISTEVISCS